MNKVHLAYVENKGTGTAPYEVTLSAGLNPIHVFGDIKTSLRHFYLTKKTPRQVLRKLEAAASKAAGENPCFRDPLIGVRDNEQDYKDMQRWASYTGIGGWPKMGETQGEAEKKARERNISRNAKLLGAYQAFIKSVYAAPENDK
jgi:hypothetical protein